MEEIEQISKIREQVMFLSDNKMITIKFDTWDLKLEPNEFKHIQEHMERALVEVISKFDQKRQESLEHTIQHRKEYKIRDEIHQYFDFYFREYGIKRAIEYAIKIAGDEFKIICYDYIVNFLANKRLFDQTDKIIENKQCSPGVAEDLCDSWVNYAFGIYETTIKTIINKISWFRNYYPTLKIYNISRRLDNSFGWKSSSTTYGKIWAIDLMIAYCQLTGDGYEGKSSRYGDRNFLSSDIVRFLIQELNLDRAKKYIEVVHGVKFSDWVKTSDLHKYHMLDTICERRLQEYLSNEKE